MAIATIETKIANPARKGNKMAKRLSAKQLKYFGTKRQKAAARAKKTNRPKAKAHRPRTKPRKNPARKVITGYGSTVMNPRKKKRNASSGKTNVVFNKSKRKRKNGSAKKRKTQRKNPGALYALVNPAGRKKAVARTRKNKSRRKRPAGSTKKRMNRRHVVRRNPGTMGRPSDWLALGSGAIVGGFGATSLPQMVLGASNTGPMGYLGMAAATAILAVGAHMVFKKNLMLTSGVIAGGTGAIIKRIIGDYTPFGQYLNAQGAAGMGDYLSGWNFTTPQIIGGNGNNQLGTPGSLPVNVAGAGAGSGRALMNV